MGARRPQNGKVRNSTKTTVFTAFSAPSSQPAETRGPTPMMRGLVGPCPPAHAPSPCTTPPPQPPLSTPYPPCLLNLKASPPPYPSPAMKSGNAFCVPVRAIAYTSGPQTRLSKGMISEVHFLYGENALSPRKWRPRTRFLAPPRGIPKTTRRASSTLFFNFCRKRILNDFVIVLGGQLSPKTAREHQRFWPGGWGLRFRRNHRKYRGFRAVRGHFRVEAAISSHNLPMLRGRSR